MVYSLFLTAKLLLLTVRCEVGTSSLIMYAFRWWLSS